MVSERTSRNVSKQANAGETRQGMEGLLSPRFKSVAAMAGWDEETLILASLVVEDTPDRSSKHKKLSESQFKTPPSTSSKRKRTANRNNILPTVPIANLDEQEMENKASNKKSEETEATKKEGITTGADKSVEQNAGVSISNQSPLCMDKLREELSCAICLELCFEPSTTSCGHSFCKKCLRWAADKCGKRCPKCRQLISNGRSCTVNTVLWNTIQLLFPQEVEARKASAAPLSNKEKSSTFKEGQIRSIERGTTGESSRDGERRFQGEDLSRLVRSSSSQRSARRLGRRIGAPTQDEDAALALRLQREEFLEAFGNRPRTSSRSLARENLEREQFLEAFSNRSRRSSSLSLARENLRAMASRATQMRRRSHRT